METELITCRDCGDALDKIYVIHDGIEEHDYCRDCAFHRRSSGPFADKCVNYCPDDARYIVISEEADGPNLNHTAVLPLCREHLDQTVKRERIAGREVMFFLVPEILQRMYS